MQNNDVADWKKVRDSAIWVDWGDKHRIAIKIWNGLTGTDAEKLVNQTIDRAKLQALADKNTSAHGASKREKLLQSNFDHLYESITLVKLIIETHPSQENKKWLKKELENISEFFRNAKFTTHIVPVIQALVQKDEKIWKEKGISAEQILEKFEALPASKASTDVDPAVLDREKALLEIYNITIFQIGDFFRFKN